MTHPLAYPVEKAGEVVGVSRTRIYEAIKSGEIVARKAGRATIIETTELLRWIQSLPMREIDSQDDGETKVIDFNVRAYPVQEKL